MRAMARRITALERRREIKCGWPRDVGYATATTTYEQAEPGSEPMPVSCVPDPMPACCICGEPHELRYVETVISSHEEAVRPAADAGADVGGRPGWGLAWPGL